MAARERLGVQVSAKHIGESGCYFLSILKLASQQPSAYPDSIGYGLGMYWTAIDKGWMQDDCLVTDPAALLTFASGTGWTFAKQERDYIPKPGELEILRFEVEKTGITYTHFVVGDGKGCVAWDPWPGSLTVRNGKLMSKRIFTPK